jgi:hypothetical protein
MAVGERMHESVHECHRELGRQACDNHCLVTRTVAFEVLLLNLA